MYRTITNLEIFPLSPTPEAPPPGAARSLVMIAKCLQNLANLVEFGGKEPNMEVVNPFILKNKERMISFLDALSVSDFGGQAGIACDETVLTGGEGL